jgi:hypothetical protein
MNTKSRKDIRVLLLQNSFKKQKKQENTNRKIYISASNKEKFCLLKEINGTECVFHILKLDKTVIYLRKYEKKTKDRI